jgi:hypothetical protein
MISTHELEAKILKYIAGSLPLDAFDQWFTAASWNMHQDSDAAAQLLAAEVELLFSEHSSGHLSDEDLKTRLWSLVGVGKWFIPVSRAEVNTTTPTTGGYSRFDLPRHRIEHYSSQSGTRGELVLPHRKEGYTLQTGIGKTLSHRG